MKELLEKTLMENKEMQIETQEGSGCGTAIIVAILVYREVLVATNEPGLAWLFTIASIIIIIGLD